MIEIADIAAQVERVFAEELYWFPVRHHSPAAARHVRAALRERAPKLVLIEGPADANHVLPHLVDKRTVPPVAIYASFRDAANAQFPVWYPLLPYSPEYVAIVEANRIGAEVAFIDLPHHARSDETEPTQPSWEAIAAESSFYKAMARVAGYRTWDEAWDGIFELGHRHATHEDFRRDLALFCAAVRATAGDRIAHDDTLPRERHMMHAIRRELAARRLAPGDAMVICGGFHVFLDRDDPEPPPTPPEGTRFATIVPYSYFRVSQLAGYGAANRAPKYYQTVWESPSHVDAMIDHVHATLARGRRAGELLTAADAIAATQHARMLAALRGRPEPILDDIRDALVTCCCKGDPSDEGRALARAMADAEVGSAIGRVTPALGRLPIVHDFHAQLAELDLGEVLERDRRVHLTLDLRDDAAARRSAFLHRLVKLDVPLAEAAPAATGDGALLFREKWTLAWSPDVEAQLVEKTLHGDTVEAAALAQLEEELAAHARHAGETCGRLREAVAMQLPHLVPRVADLAGAAIDEDRRFASLCEALVHLLVLDRMAVQRDLGRAVLAELARRAYTRACLAIGELGALPEDQREDAIGHLKSLAEAVLAGDAELPRDDLVDALTAASHTATSPFMQGAFAGMLAELRVADWAPSSSAPGELARRVAAFATAHVSHMILAGEFLDGAFAVSKASLLLGADALVGAIDELLRAAPWDDFMALLPKVRHAFERLHERQRLAFADRVARRYGLAAAEDLAPAPSAAYLATIDARVAAIMTEWNL